MRGHTEQFIDSTDQVIPHCAPMRSKKSPVQGEFHPRKALIQLSACLTTDTFQNRDSKIAIRPRNTVHAHIVHSGTCTLHEALNFSTVVNLFSIVSKLTVTNTINRVSAFTMVNTAWYWQSHITSVCVCVCVCVCVSATSLLIITKKITN